MNRLWIAAATSILLQKISALSPAAPSLTDNAPSWSCLQDRVLETPTGKRLQLEAEERAVGQGPPHTDALLRLFDAKDESDVRVTLFRDSAAWCPYCQKVWLFLEEKKIPYRIEKVPMNAYGDKPAWYTRRVDGSKLPTLELDGELYAESYEIMKLLDETFKTKEPRMFLDTNSTDAKLVKRLLHLEKELQRDWFSLVFYPVEGEVLDQARNDLKETLIRVDQALSERPGPWFLGGDTPSIVDIQYIVQMERLIASALYWKGLIIRGKYPSIDTWLEAMEQRPNYLASKSDYYTHIMVMPSQNGPGYSIDDAKEISNKIYGLDDAWKMPLDCTFEPLASQQMLNGEEGARHEAAFQLISNAKNIVCFCCRGAGEAGRPSFHAELADPYAEPNYDFEPNVDVCLRHVTSALLDGTETATFNAHTDLSEKGGTNELRPNWYEYKDDDGRLYYWDDETGSITWTPPTQQLDTCLMYLRDRVGVPRDMGQAAAMQLRAHLNWVIDILGSSKRSS
jgi:glutathione S-transferase